MNRLMILLAALVAASLPASAAETLPGPYAAEVLRVIDGDTVEVRVHVWLGQELLTHIRLRGIDAPELHGHCPGEREAAAASRDYLIGLLGNGPVTLTGIAYDKYGGRVDATMQLPSGADVSNSMLSAGQALVSKRARVRRC